MANVDCSVVGHDWEIKWQGKDHDRVNFPTGTTGIRVCRVCKHLQSNMSCWSNHKWRDGIPNDLLFRRPDLHPDWKPGNEYVPPATLERQAGLLPIPNLNYPITIIGAGGIGSFTVLGLVKMGFTNITVYDFDSVSTPNVGTQLYGERQVTLSKTEALKNVIALCGDANARITTRGRYLGGRIDGIMIVAVDSMAERKKIWASMIGTDNFVYCTAYIDARMGAEHINFYAINPTSHTERAVYQATLYDDTQALQEPCTARATVYTGFLVAGLICKTVRDLLDYSPDAPHIAQWNIRDNAQEITPRKEYDHRLQMDRILRQRAGVKYWSHGDDSGGPAFAQ